jgi:signal transduction histidine kinase
VTWPKPLRSLTLRLTLAYMLMFCASVGVMLGVSYVSGVWRPLQAVESEIRADSDQLAEVWRLKGRNALIRALEQRANRARGRLPYHVLVAPGGGVVAANLSDWPKRRGDEWLRYEFGTYATGAEEEHEAVVRDMPLTGGWRLIVGLDTEDLDEREDLILEALSWGAGMTLTLGFLGGLVMTFAISRRLEAISRAARAVIAGDLSGRVKLSGAGDDFDQLAGTLNEMLERIEALVATISRVSDNIAHELRTPLSRLRAELEELAETDDHEEARERSLAALDEAQRLQAMFEALLRIARLESGPADAMQDLDLSAILADAAELHQPSAEDRGQTLDAEAPPGLVVRGDRDLIFQMVSNLLDNAVKFALEGGHVRLAGRREGQDVVVSVEDDGPGVKLEERKRVFERFYRAPGAAQAQGFGLGLSLVAAAASRHGASIRLEDAGPGLRVTVRFPTPDHQRPAL